ncbi:MAG: hypothetical protein M1814_003134 [Vezdaea aestivalis]|nr:MAG: hypothetical protein M1814_003134 [Vezdaea aestivalis]
MGLDSPPLPHPHPGTASPVLLPSTPPSFSRDISVLCLSDLAVPSSDASPPLPTEAISPPPTHRSHDPRNNLKRSDPFQFGSRYLLENDDVFEFNAWDHVETDEAYKDYSEAQYAAQRDSPVSEFDKKRFNDDPSKWWTLFYRNNTSNFFKDRKWLFQEFPILTSFTASTSPPATILEVGAGAGNTAFPIISHNSNPNLKVHALDFSVEAVSVLRSHSSFNSAHMTADVWDVSGPKLPPGLGAGSVDAVLMIFVFSALAPEQWAQAVRNVWTVLKPGGTVLFRDYGRGDLAQVRFKKGRWMEENFYVRGDGTRVYFFEKEELRNIWAGEPRIERDGKESKQQAEKTTDEKASFEVLELGVDKRLLVNRQRKLKMYRCWLQGLFRKPGGDEAGGVAGSSVSAEKGKAVMGEELGTASTNA